MISDIISHLTTFIIYVINSTGYVGVGLLMAIESAAIPLPSEIIMPFAGFLVSEGKFNLFGVALAGGVGSAVGSAITYAIGRYGGRPFVERYGKYFLVSAHDLEISDRFFARFGGMSTFMGRLLPVVRTFISIPAGIAKVNFPKFLLYSFLGSVLWSLLLAYFGMKLGPAWLSLRERFHWLDYIIAAIIVLGAIWWVARHIRGRTSRRRPS
jgi:membrane protein DedA with SNARE-associated domain